MDDGAAPRYSRAQVDNCAFAAWYPSFEHVSIKSAVIPLPPAFVSLILADGVVLPDALKAQEQLLALASVRKQVDAVLRRFKGKAFPKLNWSSPRDASWMLGTMQCVNFEDVFLLLKASDFAVHDMTEAYAGCEADNNSTTVDQVRSMGPENVYLVLKKWCSFFDSMLFRCFVVSGALVGVSQRNCDEYFPFLFDQQDHLCERIYTFFDAHFRKQNGSKKSAVFPDPDFIFDVYVDKQHRVYLLDINVFGGVTDPLLFSWEELMELRGAHERSTTSTRSADNEEDSDDDDDVHEVVDFRIVESELSIHPNPLSGYRVPTDLVNHLAGGAGFEAFMDQVKRDNAQDDDESSSDDDGEQEEDDDDDDGVLWGSDNDD